MVAVCIGNKLFQRRVISRPVTQISSVVTVIQPNGCERYELYTELLNSRFYLQRVLSNFYFSSP